MFGLGMMEILMILAIALIVVGPKKLPELAKTLGRAMGEFKRSAQELKRSIDIETTVQDVEVPKTDLKEILKETAIHKKSSQTENSAYTDAPFSENNKPNASAQTDENSSDPDDAKPQTP